MHSSCVDLVFTPVPELMPDSGILVFGGQFLNDTNPSATAKSVRFWSDKYKKWMVNDTRLVLLLLKSGKLMRKVLKTSNNAPWFFPI